MRATAKRLAILLILSLATVALAADDPHDINLKFASGLREFGYYDLAAGQFKALKEAAARDKKEPAFRAQVAEGLIESYVAAARAAARADVALDYTRLAAEEIDAFLHTDLNEVDRTRFSVKLGDMLLEQGRMARDVYRRKPKGVDLNTVAARGEDAFVRAAEAFRQGVSGYRSIVKQVESKDDVDDADRILRQESLMAQIAAETQVGWARFRRAQLLRDQNKLKPFQDEVRVAIKIFQDLSTTHKEIVAGFSATLGWALCLQELGEHKKAIDAFDQVLEATPSKNLIPIRFQALYEKTASQVALSDYDGASATFETIRKEFPKLPPALDQAFQMRYAKAVGQAADVLRARADKLAAEAKALREKNDAPSRKKARGLDGKVKAIRKRYRRPYEKAVKLARKLAEPGNPYEQEANLLIGKWVAAGGLKLRRRASDHFADGEHLLASGDPAGAVKAFREAIRAAKRSKDDKKITHDAWIQMGKSYAKLKKNYEAGLVLGHVAHLFPESPYAEKSAVYSAMLLGNQYARGRKHFEAQAYLQAQELLVDRFPRTEAAKRAAFRLGDVRRGQKHYARAASFYQKVDRASEYYERAGYLAGQCLWEAYSEQQKAQADADVLEKRFQAAKAQLESFIAWAAEQPRGSEETMKTRRIWTAKSRLLLGQMFFAQGQFDSVLDVLSDRIVVELDRLPAEHRNLTGNARLYRLRAHCALNQPEHTRMAAAEMDALRTDTQIENTFKSTAARFLGFTFLKQANELATQKNIKPGQTHPQHVALLGSARTYLMMALQLDQKQKLNVYDEIASALYTAGAYDDSAEVFKLLVGRFGREPQHKDVIRDARRWIGRCHMQARKWHKAMEAFEGLLKDFPRWTEVHRELALCYESPDLKRFVDAEKHWRIIEDAFPMGKPRWFEARYHRISNLANQARADLAFQMLAATVVPYPELGGAQWKDKFIQLANKKFSKEQAETFKKLREDALAP